MQRLEGGVKQLAATSTTSFLLYGGLNLCFWSEKRVNVNPQSKVQNVKKCIYKTRSKLHFERDEMRFFFELNREQS